MFMYVHYVSVYVHSLFIFLSRGIAGPALLQNADLKFAQDRNTFFFPFQNYCGLYLLKKNKSIKKESN